MYKQDNNWVVAQMIFTGTAYVGEYQSRSLSSMLKVIETQWVPNAGNSNTFKLFSKKVSPRKRTRYKEKYPYIEGAPIPCVIIKPKVN